MSVAAHRARHGHWARRVLLACAFAGAGSPATAAGLTGGDIDEVVIRANRLLLVGAPRAASEGTVLAEQLENRPLARTGEILEVVPGMIVTQHTGDGKANQYFLRGFNLDHGTDFVTRVEGVPVNLPTHAHGHGYMDLNFLIPELVERIVYRKGTYYPELGDFSAAGAADMTYLGEVEPFISLSGGENGYMRAIAAGSTRVADGELLVGLEHARGDGPWLLDQDLRRHNVLARFARAGERTDLSLTFSGYRGDWRATDQIPLRAVRDGRIDRFGFVDPTNGGKSHRYALSGRGVQRFGERELAASAYVVDYGLQLFSNFTYGLDTIHGDQFEQLDDRRNYGGALAWSQPLSLGGRSFTWRAGLELRHDALAPVGLHLTRSRVRHATIREDEVRQRLGGVWTGLATHWWPWLRSEMGVRLDRLDYRVRSDLQANSGAGHASRSSPKLALTLGPWRHTEWFLAAGRGFHSNDARGATIRVDPADGSTPVQSVTPLVAAEGAEIGLRTALIPRSQLSLVLWQLDIDSELLFIGDGGVTEATRPSRRRGLELGFYARPREWLIVDADLAWSRARFRDRDPLGERIPGAIERVGSLGLAIEPPSGWFAGARLRHLGPAALVEDDSVRSSSSTLVNLELGRRVGGRWKVAVALYNAFDREASDINYFYESRLPGEQAPSADVHFHPAEPRTLRLTVEARL